MPILLLTAADRENVIKSETCIILPKMKHRIGTNYLGHYALTAQLLPLLRRGHKPRVVNLSSIAHRTGFIHFSDLQGERLYSPWKAYNQSAAPERRGRLEFDE